MSLTHETEQSPTTRAGLVRHGWYWLKLCSGLGSWRK